MAMQNELDVAEEIPYHQTSRGREFNDIPPTDRIPLARQLIIARSQATASNGDWDSSEYRRSIMRTKVSYYYQAGRLGVDETEAETIWWSFVHDDPSPYEKRSQGLI